MAKTPIAPQPATQTEPTETIGAVAAETLTTSTDAAPVASVAPEPEPAPDFVKLRLKTHRFPYRRAGYVFISARQWHEVGLLSDSVEAMETLRAWVADPEINVQIQFADEWTTFAQSIPAHLKTVSELVEVIRAAPIGD